ncbi:MAG: hypothetical protein JXB45_05000 [Candidatus Krumholzibacteriota bacterium]|nr:hypothetical protein [Candidatus Krumholzibacteriota bacterium]
MTATRTIGIIVTHGRLAFELLETVNLIVGRKDCCAAIAGSDLSDRELTSRIKEVIEENSDKYVLLFVDYFGGSCYMNCQRAAHGKDRIKVISGVNLPILLDFVTKEGSLEVEEMIEHLVQRGRESIKVIDVW